MTHDKLILGNELRLFESFAKNRNMYYYVTGSMALQILGALPVGYDVHDLDFIVIANCKEDFENYQNYFAELSRFCGNKATDYPDAPFVFKIGKNNTLANVWVRMYCEETKDVITVNIEGNCYNVMRFGTCLNRKMKLQRVKDFHYQGSLISLIANAHKGVAVLA